MVNEHTEIKKTVGNIIDDVLFNINFDKTFPKEMNKNLENDLGADSIEQVEILMQIERIYEIAISDEDAMKLNTPNDIVNLVEKQLKTKNTIRQNAFNAATMRKNLFANIKQKIK